jgi:putative membrane protein
MERLLARLFIIILLWKTRSDDPTIPRRAGTMRHLYERFADDEIILRDYLAADRTALANERTLLAYIRTALASAIAGASAIHFLEGSFSAVLGATLVIASVIMTIVGSMRYLQYKRRINNILARGNALIRGNNE